MNYLYNGVEFPDINEAWTDEVKETHPYAVIEYAVTAANGYHIANLIIAPSCTAGYSSLGGAVLVYTDGYLFRQIGWYDTDGIPTTWGDPSSVTSSQTRAAESTKWTSTDILNDDGTLYLAASEPVPVTTTEPIDHASMLMGWMVGRRIAGLRGEKKQVSATGVYDDEFPIQWNSLAVADNVKVDLGSDSQVLLKVSNLAPTADELQSCEYTIVLGEDTYTGSCTGIGGADDITVAVYNDIGGFVLVSVSAPMDFDGLVFPESGLYWETVIGDISFDITITLPSVVTYNGVELPDIETVWTDKETYPYAFIVELVTHSGSYAFIMSATPVYQAGTTVRLVAGPGDSECYEVNGNAWSLLWTVSGGAAGSGLVDNSIVIWTNTDINDASGALFLAASDPVYES